MATPVPHIKSAARKLPIKRKSPTKSQSQTLIPSLDPNPLAPNLPNPNPNPIDPLHPPKSEPHYPSTIDDAYEDEYEVEEEEDDNSIVGSDDLKPLPFKFHRIWTESDEIRFLQGLIGCWSKGMVFPRDLNLFYDRFSESMPQPYTRCQLSEKLRRLRKKHRTMSGRIARGQDPSRLAPHDRDLLHLCTRLWDPAYAASSPFGASEGSGATAGNKRRRAKPRPPSVAVEVAASASPLLPLPDIHTPTISSHSDPIPIPASDEKAACPDDRNPPAGFDEAKKPLPVHPPAPAAGDDAGKGCFGNPLAKTVLDVFDGTLSELRAILFSNGVLEPGKNLGSGSSGGDFKRRWQEQRLMELDVLASRLRLVIEGSIQG